ncbi:MAG: hypothetical protein R3C59_17220 [Planctomycetaceae bacterium]
MTGIYGSLAAFSVTVVLFCLSLLCFSLRDFSRSRLEQFCQKRGRLERFGIILQNHEKCLLLSELLLLWLWLTTAWVVARTNLFGDLTLPADQKWPAQATWAIEMAACCNRRSRVCRDSMDVIASHRRIIPALLVAVRVGGVQTVRSDLASCSETGLHCASRVRCARTGFRSGDQSADPGIADGG